MSDKRNQLESAATDAVQYAGLHNLSFRTLAEAVGVKSSSVHYYFPEKSDLAGVLIEKYTSGFAHRLEEISAQKLDARGQFKEFVKIFEEVLQDDRLCLCGMLAAEVSTLSDDNRKRLTQFFKVAEDWLVSVFDSHNATGGRQLDAKLLAKAALSGLEGAILVDRVRQGRQAIGAQRDFVLQMMD